jgi:SAM-dependent methyltransferase/uncharacterized protein YbaR (Trm112 family)
MREALLELLACPLCQHDDLALTIHARDEREIREGELVCQSCQARIPIQKGIVNAFLNPSQQVLDEAKGWVDLLDVPAKQHEFKDDWILALPFIRPEQTREPESVRIWHRMGENFFENLDRFDWRGKRVLEIGAGRCWGVAELARRGAYAVGLDILAHKYLGLETADIWFAAKDLYFERVLGDMHQLPFRPGAFDFVLTSSSLHHTDRLVGALKEVTRVLDTKGRAFFINEPVIPDGCPKPDMSNSPEVAHGIIESRPTYREWIRAFRMADLYVENAWFKEDMHILLRRDIAIPCPRLQNWKMYGPLVTLYLIRFRFWVREMMQRALSAPGYYGRRLKERLFGH